jgi:CRP/FNR family cyclic AMP-dependent transcriptional regulator
MPFMNIEEKTRLLRSFELLNRLNSKDIRLIAKYFQYKTLPKQTSFITEGGMESEMYFIVSGLVRVYHLHENGKEMTIAIRVPGEIVGEMAPIEDKPRSASAETLQDSTLFVLTKKNFLKLLKKYPTVGLVFLKILSHRLRKNLRLRKLISFQTLKDRTYDVLRTLSSYFSGSDVTLSHEQISALVNATQPRVTETLHALQKNHRINLTRKKIHVF